MPENIAIIAGTIIVIAFILILYVLENSLYDKIENIISELAKKLLSYFEGVKEFQQQLTEIKSILLEKRPLDLQILQKIMIYLSNEGLIEMPTMMFERRNVNDDNFIIEFTSSHLQLMIEIIARYTGHNFPADFPVIAHNKRENPDVIRNNYGEKLKEYFTDANKILGK
jgi:hypothetical protein